MTERHENLLAAYFADQLTEEEKTELLTLLDTDSELQSRFLELQEAFVAACVPAFEKTREEDFRRLSSRMQPRTGIISWRAFAFAASVAAIAFLGAALYSGIKYHNTEKFLARTEATVISSTRGTGTETTLPDGTRVCLNAGSSLSLGRSFGRSSRDVTLEGEGFFDVAKDATRPFRVHSGNTRVTVKGTKFNVRNYASEPDITVSLLEGSVLLSAPSGETTLRPGTSAVVSRTSGRIRLLTADASVSDWTKGKIVFSDKTIPEILAIIERNYGVRFEYDADLFKGERFTGNISTGLSIDEILSYIDVDHKFVWQRHDDTIVIRKK